MFGRELFLIQCYVEMYELPTEHLIGSMKIFYRLELLLLTWLNDSFPKTQEA